MAKSKKKSASKTSARKTSSKAAPKSSGSKKGAKASAPKHRAARVLPAGLTNDDKQRLLKPGQNYDSVAADSAAAWKANSRYLRIDGLSVGKFQSTVKKALRAWDKERVFRAKMDSKLQPLMDARMRLENDVMRNLLDLNAEVKTAARRRPELLDAFASLADFCSRGGGRPSSDGGDQGGGGGIGSSGGTPPS